MFAVLRSANSAERVVPMKKANGNTCGLLHYGIKEDID